MIQTSRSYKKYEYLLPMKYNNPNLDYQSVNIRKYSSLEMADLLGIKHFHIMRDIRRMKCSKDFRMNHIYLNYYISSNNREYPYYIMNSPAVALLTVSYRMSQEMRENLIESIFSKF
jgi:Rha family phage regulatory protein